MKFKKTPLKDLILIKYIKHQDIRGIFFRNYFKNEFKKKNINFVVKQTNVSINKHKHTLRGFHYQTKPFQEAKIITPICGSIFNVSIDLRRKSKTFLKHHSFILDSKSNSSVYLPSGFANAFISLESNTTIFYLMDNFFNPKSYRGFRYNDPYFKVQWPSKPKIISQRDKNFENFDIELI